MLVSLCEIKKGPDSREAFVAEDASALSDRILYEINAGVAIDDGPRREILRAIVDGDHDGACYLFNKSNKSGMHVTRASVPFVTSQIRLLREVLAKQILAKEETASFC
jgi:hypothetical protein